MKKVLKLIVLVAVISALTLVAFAASSPSTEVIPDESGADELIAIIAEQIPEGYDIEVVPPTENADAGSLRGNTLTPYGLGVLEAHSISLSGDIGVKFYMHFEGDIAQSETAYMLFTVPADSGNVTQKVYVRDAETVESGGKTLHIFKCGVSAKEMTTQIQAQMINGDEE